MIEIFTKTFTVEVPYALLGALIGLALHSLYTTIYNLLRYLRRKK